MVVVVLPNTFRGMGAVMQSLRPVLRPFFEVLVLTLDGLKDLKNCGLKGALNPNFLNFTKNRKKYCF